MRVLLLEDHADLREMIGDYLTRRGFAVDAVECGEEAIAAVSTTTYDAVVLDLGLPDIDGIEVLATVRAWTKGRLTALIVTARDSIDHRVKCLNAGAADYIAKRSEERRVGKEGGS